jgi:acetolactate decarboxylase
MKIIILFAFLAILSIGCTSQNAENSTLSLAEVNANGALQEVMLNGNLKANILIDTLEKQGLMGVGPLGRLQGEITILDGKALVTRIDSAGNPMAVEADSLQAPFFAYANVSNWQTFGFLKGVSDLPSLQAAIEELATIMGYDLTKPFPFHIKGKVNKAGYHIISKPTDELEHSHDLHKAAKVNFEVEEEEVIFVGFYSQAHQGVFTHMGDFTHIHIILPNGNFTGHLDEITARANTLELWAGLM